MGGGFQSVSQSGRAKEARGEGVFVIRECVSGDWWLFSWGEGYLDTLIWLVGWLG